MLKINVAQTLLAVNKRICKLILGQSSHILKIKNKLYFKFVTFFLENVFCIVVVIILSPHQRYNCPDGSSLLLFNAIDFEKINEMEFSNENVSLHAQISATH